VGQIVFDAETAIKQKKNGLKVVLVRHFTKPEDVVGFFSSEGVLTAEGGATSHAAVVARQFGLPCVCGASSLDIDYEARKVTIEVSGKKVELKELDFISLDATHGDVFLGKINRVAADFHKEKELIVCFSLALHSSPLCECSLV
jgi:pyruvate,orthophosphate dikinase